MSAQCAKPIYVFRTCEHDLRKQERHLSMQLIWVWIHFRILPALFGNPCIYLHSIPIVGLRSKLEFWDKTSHAGIGPEISRQLASACVNRFNAVRNLTKSSLQSGLHSTGSAAKLSAETVDWTDVKQSHIGSTWTCLLDQRLRPVPLPRTIPLI